MLLLAACVQPHLSLPEQRDGLAHVTQHGAHFDVIGGHHHRRRFAPQLKLLNDLLLVRPLPSYSLPQAETHYAIHSEHAFTRSGCTQAAAYIRQIEGSLLRHGARLQGL
jgi:hypothetical protein